MTILRKPALPDSHRTQPEAVATRRGLFAVPPLAVGWRNACLGLAAGFVLLVALFWGAASGMIRTWYVSSTFNHGFLIVPICFYLVWLRRDRLAAIVPRQDYRGIWIVGACAFLWLLGKVAEILMVQQFALVGMIQGLVFTVIGRRATAALVFPLFYLVFAVPVGEHLVPPLQDLTAIMAVDLLRLTGVPVFNDGLFIAIPTGNFEVAEACSGVRFLIATIALGFLFANINYRALWRRALFVLLAVVIPVVANGFRAFGIIMIAYLTNNRLAVGVDHIVYGWIFFAVVTVILLLVGLTFRERDGRSDAPARPAAAGRPGPAGTIVGVAVCVIVAAIAPAYAAYIDRDGRPPTAVALPAPAVGGGWRLLATYGDDWRPAFPGADAALLRTYLKNGKRVHLFIAYYTHQRHGAEIVSRNNSLVGAAGDGRRGWGRAGGGDARAAIEGTPMTVEATRLLRRGDHRIVWSWYWIGGRFTADMLRAKLLETRAKLMGGPRAAAMVAVSTDYQDEAGEAALVLRDFMHNIEPLSRLLTRLSTRSSAVSGRATRG